MEGLLHPALRSRRHVRTAKVVITIVIGIAHQRSVMIIVSVATTTGHDHAPSPSSVSSHPSIPRSSPNEARFDTHREIHSYCSVQTSETARHLPEIANDKAIIHARKIFRTELKPNWKIPKPPTTRFSFEAPRLLQEVVVHPHSNDEQLKELYAKE
jgi:hypothetical protein